MPNIKPVKKSNGNVFKTIVRSVVKEELVKSEKRLEQSLVQRIDQKFGLLSQHLTERIDGKIERKFTVLTENLIEHMNQLFAKYRDETLTKLDTVISKLQKTNEEQTIHTGQHEASEERLVKLEEIHPHGQHTS